MAAETENKTRQRDQRRGRRATEGAGLLASEPGAWLGASPPGDHERVGKGSSHMEAPSRKRQKACRSKRKGQPEQAGKAADAARRRPEGQRAEAREGKPEEKCRRGPRRRGRGGRTGRERRSREERATAEKKGESRGRKPARRRAAVRRERTSKRRTCTDTNSARRADWKKSKARACRPPRAGKSDRQGEGERAGARAEAATETAGGPKSDGERGQPHRRQAQGRPRPGGPEEWRWR